MNTVSRFFAAFSCIFLCSCGNAIQATTDRVTEVALGAVGIKLPGKTDAPPPIRVIDIHIEGASNLNAGENEEGLATVMRIFKLRNPNSFLGMAYSSFGNVEKEKQALGADLTEAREIILSPGQKLDFNEKIPAESAYVGIVALFRTPFPQRWRFAFATKDAEHSGITIGAHACALTTTNLAPHGMAVNETALLSPVRCQ
ncbi:MAG TPA: type VI secretion system lipoprotein TssJ [Noviherbaspirillum sp.]|nr:type VI secretion system lipoprotein TssJ [Noviherbaspirillum sp.]